MKLSLPDDDGARLLAAFVMFVLGVLLSPPAAATDIHAEWSNQHIAELFPAPLDGWTIAEMSLEERDTVTSGFESYVGGLAGTDAGVSMRLVATRLYLAAEQIITVKVDSLDIESAASIDATATALQTDDTLRRALEEEGVRIISHGNTFGFSAQEDDRSGVFFKIGSAGIIGMECDYQGCAADLAQMMQQLEFERLSNFADFDHRK